MFDSAYAFSNSARAIAPIRSPRRVTLPAREPETPLDYQWAKALDALDVAFQPIVNIHTGACYGYEALLRNHEEAGFASIQDVFDSACALGMLVELEMALREKAVARFVRLDHWRQAKLFLNLDNRALSSHPELAGCALRFDLVAVTPWRLPRHLTDVWRE